MLVVEDDNASRGVIRDTLESAGWGVEEATNGSSGLDLLRRNRPDAIMLDLIQMPPARAS